MRDLFAPELRRDTLALCGSFFFCLLANYVGILLLVATLTGAGFTQAAASNAVRIKIGSIDEAPVASSTSDALLPANTIERIHVTPKSRLSAISNDAATPVLNIVELSS